MARVDSFLELCVAGKCSDLHLAIGVPPLLRWNGVLNPIKFRDLGEAELEGYIDEMLAGSQKARFAAGDDLDFSYYASGIGRFRVNLYRTINGPRAAMRYVPEQIPDLDSLGLPEAVSKFTEFSQGLILVTGPTGSGKSTSLAALIHKINCTRSDNIITLEDPIEFVHTSQKSQIIQREIGTHVHSFSDGLRAALREDPDVILVGEMRDAETISMALVAAETGHLVFGTLHTTTAVKSVDRILDALPSGQREQAKMLLSQHLHAVLTQYLVRSWNGESRKAVCELMLMNHALSHLILQDKTFQIPNLIQMARDQGMQLMDHALMKGVQARELNPDDAYACALDKRPFERFVTDPKLAGA